ncbi:MAG: hypothetical protein M1833_001205 [Piccolia ochrophora]|nr:MAG: hypothetical protein M1833_001205 [Piccolia ochrophora]
MTFKVIIVTGASRGIGHAVATFLLRPPGTSKVVLLARTAAPLEELQSQYPDRVQVVTGDLTDYALARRAVEAAVGEWGRLDGMVLNHGTLDPVGRVADSSTEEWGETFKLNFLSCLEFVSVSSTEPERGALVEGVVDEREGTQVKLALPHLRASKGRVVFTSSGAALHAYSAWGAYGASKAALNHLAQTLAREEPDVTTLAIRPGVVDTEMQRQLREDYFEKLDDVDKEKFGKLKSEGKLLRPEQPGHVMARLVLDVGKELSGKYASWDDEVLAAFRD